MKSRAKKVSRGIMIALGLLVIIAAAFIAIYAGFPGKIRETSFQGETKSEGTKTIFRQGVAYRYPGLPPLVEVAGDPYEMGLQYGVLLRPEIMTALDALGKFLNGQARGAGVPSILMTAGVKFKAAQLARRLPRRYRDEMRGVADGAGIPESTVVVVSLLYDIYQSMMACTGVLFKGPQGSIIQGRLNDMAGFGEVSRIAAIVRHKPRGLNAFIHMDLPLYLGVETGMNDKGLCCGGETLRIKKADGHGFSHPFLMRMILEEAGTLDGIYPYFDRFHQVGADGVVWSDLRNGRGAVVEMTPTAWAKHELDGPILWDFNRFYDQALAGQQIPSYGIIGVNLDREAIASAFAKKPEYSFDDAVDFLRNQTGPDGTNYSWSGTRFPICNKRTTQMMIFDSRSDGFYMAMGPSFASRREIYHFFGDFAKAPELFRSAGPIDPRAEAAAEIESRMLPDGESLQALRKFADAHGDDANAQFLVAEKAFRISKPRIFGVYAEKAFRHNPSEPEYRLFAGLAAYQRKDPEGAISVLEAVVTRCPEQEIFRLAALERAWAGKDAGQSAGFGDKKRALLEIHGVSAYYKKHMKPLIDVLERKNREKGEIQ